MVEKRSLLLVRWLPAALLLCVCLSACFKSEPRVGSETHFMRLCSGDTCGENLSCICGVCTEACKSDAVCKDLAGEASCQPLNAESTACAESMPPARACDARCDVDEDCKPLGTGFACVGGACRERVKIGSPGDAGSIGGEHPMMTDGVTGDAATSQCSGSECAVADAPLVMLLVDTSGSMERLPSCSCTSPGCAECLPDCAKKDRNRWTAVLEALTGTYDDYSCVELPRTAENGASFDLGYPLPYFVPQGAQRADGLLDAYRDKLRFGLATFDGWDTWRGAPPMVSVADFDDDLSDSVDGLWSYAPEQASDDASLRRQDGTRIGTLRYSDTTQEYRIDTGVRGPNAVQGALVAAALRSADDQPLTPADVELTNDSIQLSLLRVTPYGGTPIAASFDDLYWFLERDPTMAAERASGKRPYIILITDGYPDDDYRSFGCDCAKTNDCGTKDDPSKMHCPYPTAEEAARALHCGEGETCGSGPATRVEVVGFALDTSIVTAVNDIAVAGGSEKAHLAASGDSLRSQLGAILDEIIAAH